MEKMGSVFVMVILAIFSYRGLGFGNLVHRYNYLYPGRIPASKNGKGSHPEDTMTHKPDHAVKAERPWNIKNKTSEHLKIIAVFSCIMIFFFHL